MNISSIKAFLFKTYIYGATFLTILFIVLKCHFKITIFDKFLYIPKESQETNNLMYYILFHVIFYFVLGLIFKHDDLWIQILQTIFVEFALLYGENCTIQNANYQSAIISIFVGMISYILGGWFMKILFS